MTTYAPVRPRVRQRAPIDPRIRARRVAVTREHGRRRLHRVLWVLGLLAAAALATGAVLSPVLDINRIAVRGVEGPHAEEVRRAIGIAPGEPLLLADTGAAAVRIEQLEWVDEVRVERKLPGTLRVVVTPRFPVAWRSTADGTIVLLDRAGAAISRQTEVPEGLLQVDARADGRRAGARVAAALSPGLRLFIGQLVVRDGQVAAILKNGVAIRFGDPSGARAKGAAAEAVLQAIAGAPIRYVDVSVPSAPVTG